MTAISGLAGARAREQQPENRSTRTAEGMLPQRLWKNTATAAEVKGFRAASESQATELQIDDP